MKVPSIVSNLFSAIMFIFVLVYVFLILKALQPLLMLLIVCIPIFSIGAAFSTEQPKNGWVLISGFLAYGTSWLIAAKINIWFGTVVCVAGIIAVFIATVSTWATLFARMNNKQIEA